MKNKLQLLLPALLPSWRFFDIIAPSPRIQYTLLNSAKESPVWWHEFRPRPATLSFIDMLKRMIWNPQWNETLFMVSCAERINEHYTQHSEDEILKRIIHELTLDPHKTTTISAKYVQFRLVFIERQNNQLQQSIEFQSRIAALPAQVRP